MKKVKRIIVIAITAALLLSGCAQENKSFSELMESKNNSTQQPSDASSPLQAEASVSEVIEEKSSEWMTLAEAIEEYEYNGCRLEYPNFESISVGMLYKDENHRHCLFDSNGYVRHIFDEGIYISSGFYNGMCLTNAGTMVDEDGMDATPAWLPEDERVIRYAKDEAGILLWTVKREDGIDGTKLTLIARQMDGSVYFQCDTTQPEFSELNPSDLYNAIVSSGYNVGEKGISTPFIYCGGTLYRVRGKRGYVFINIANRRLYYISEYNACLIQMENGAMIQTAPSLRVRDEDFNVLTEWKDIKSRRSETPVLSEGLIYLDVRRDSGEFENYPSGFYDVHLNRVIDLSQYNIQSVTQNEPRFINGYAALQMLTPDGVAFWGVIRKDGTWSAEPQKGTIKYVFPTADGILISTCDENDDQFQTYTQDGTLLSNWNGMKFSGYYGYAEDGSVGYGCCEVYNGYLYTNLDGHIAKISSDGNYEFIS